MSTSSATNLLELPKSAVQKMISAFDTVLVDCDGVLWHEDTAIPGSPETINHLKKIGKRVFFVTNNSVKTRHELWQRAHALGFEVDETDIIAPLHAIGEYLRDLNFQKKVYVIGCDAATRELERFKIEHLGTGPDLLESSVIDFINKEIAPANADEVGAVIVGFDEHFTYPKMMRASHYLGMNKNCLFIATNADPVQRFPKFHIPGTGAILSAVETCIGKKALNFGKPEPRVCQRLIADGVIKPERTLMIGDCCRVDIPFGKNCGFRTLMVGSGNTKFDYLQKVMEDKVANQIYIPDFYLSTLGDLLEFLPEGIN